jgi:hypothetical protein
LWQEVVRQNPNVFLVVSGHITDSEHRMMDRISGNPVESATPTTVHEILTDYQAEPGLNAKHLPPHLQVRDNGNGWLRTLQFRPSQRTIHVSVHSVLDAGAFNLGNNEGKPYENVATKQPHTFDIDYDMNPTPPTTGAPPSDRFADRVVNSSQTRNQLTPGLAAAENGDWVAVWEDDSHGAEGVYQIYARGFDAEGCERFHDRVVNTVATGQQLKPAVAADPTGRFVVAWEDNGGDQFYQVKVRGFKADGTQRFSQRTVNTDATGQQRKPAVATDAEGNFVVVWEDDGGDGKYQIKARGFKADGSQRFSQRTVNSVAKGQQRHATIAMNANGQFVVVWEDDGGDGIYQIKARGFNADGSERFSQRTVNAVAAGQQYRPAIGMDAAGNFVVAWEDDQGSDGIYQIKARGFRPDGSLLFGQILVNTVATGQQRKPNVAVHPDGRFVVAWEDSGGDDVYQIKARAFGPDGHELWGQLKVNRLSSGQQRAPAVAIAPSGQFVVAWQDDLEKNNWWEILARGCSLASRCNYKEEEPSDTVSLP